MEEVKFDYDRENDSLFLYKSEEKVRGSVELGDFVIDFNPNLNKVVSLEIMNASKRLPVALSNKINKTTLKNIKKAVLRTQHKDNVIYVIYGILSMVRNEQIKEETLMPVMLAHEH